MNKIKEDLIAQVDELKVDAQKYLNKEITMPVFKALSGKFGIYAQRGGENFVVRIKIPYGLFQKRELNLVLELAKKYDVEDIHLTTGQCIQFHNITIDTAVNVFKDCLSKDLINYGCGGNHVRNLTLSPLSGALKGEEFCILKYAKAVDTFALARCTEKLPRKLKIYMANKENEAYGKSTISDLGIVAINKDGKRYFKLFIGGAATRNPEFGVEYGELIEADKILYYIDALMDFFKAYGNYENRNAARVKYILVEKGEKEFLTLFRSYVDASFKKGVDLTIKDTDEVIIPSIDGEENKDLNIIAQKQKGRYSVSLKFIGGWISTANFEKLVNYLCSLENDYVVGKISADQELFISNLSSKEATNLLDLVKPFNETTRLLRSISCVGVPICQIGLAESHSLLLNIANHFKTKNLSKDLLPTLHLSGCPNDCSRSTFSGVGLSGRKKMVDGKISDAFELFIKDDGLSREFAKTYGIIIASNIPLFLEDVYKKLDENNLDFMKFKDTEEFTKILSSYKV